MLPLASLSFIKALILASDRPASTGHLRSLFLALVAWTLGMEVALLGGACARIRSRLYNAAVGSFVTQAEWHQHYVMSIGECFDVVAFTTFFLKGYRIHY